MMRRMFWFLLGIAAGISGYVWVKRTAADLHDRVTPEALLRACVNAVQRGLRSVVELVKSSRSHEESSPT